MIAGRGRVIWAAAKVNLFLDVLGKRSDGYHELATLIVPVGLYDTLEVHPREDGELSLTCDQPGLPTDERNLVWKAADALRRRAGVSAGASVRLVKRIPQEAGLGGGSSDAAAVLAALNAVWHLNLGRSDLASVAAGVGSDVAALLPGAGATWCTGRGEVVEPTPAGGPLHLVVVKPPVGCSTAEVYRRVRQSDHPVDGTVIRHALAAGDSAAVADALHNRLESAAFDLQPMVKQVYDRLNSYRPLGCRLTGSGACVFAVCRDRADAARIARRFEDDATDLPGCRVFAVPTTGAVP